MDLAADYIQKRTEIMNSNTSKQNIAKVKHREKKE